MWLQGIIGGCRETTWVTTIGGRRRHLPNIRASGKNNNAERLQARVPVEIEAPASCHARQVASSIQHAVCMSCKATLEIWSSHHVCVLCCCMLCLQAERQAVNSVCQGSAADIVKGAMLQLMQQLEQRGWAGNARLLLQVWGGWQLHYTKLDQCLCCAFIILL
jgi:DNA polymerase I-like protein with 3'-5' exonuclease and polymerase domains